MLILTANQLALAASERDRFQALRAQMLRDLDPVSSLQIEFFNQALRHAWTVRRCDAAELHLATESGLDPLLLKDTRVDRLHRLGRQAERAYRQAIAELKKLTQSQGWPAARPQPLLSGRGTPLRWPGSR